MRDMMQKWQFDSMFPRFVTFFFNIPNKLENHEKNMDVTNTKFTKHHEYSSLIKI